MPSREERDARRHADTQRLLDAAARFKQLSAAERAAAASRLDLTEDEQVALAAFADEPDVARAIEGNENMCDSALGIAHAVARKNRPWWQKLLRP